GPLTRSVADSALVYDVVRGNLPTDLYRAGGDEPFVEAAARQPGRLRIGWSLKVPPPRPRNPPGPHGAAPPQPGRRRIGGSLKVPALGLPNAPVHAAAVRDTARLLAGLGHDVRE